MTAEIADDLATIAPADPSRFADESWAPVFARLRAEAPVHYTAESPWGAYWSVTRYADIMQVDRDHHTFSSEVGGVSLGDPDPNLRIRNFIRSDPPVHDAWRGTFSPVVSPRNLKELEALIRRRVAGILDALPIDEEFDWVEAVSVELTTQMLATLFNFPFEERRKLTHWSDMATATPAVGNFSVSDEERYAAAHECLEYFRGLIEERRRNPATGELDFVSALAQNRDMDALTPMEILGNVQLLIIGGNDTTRNSLSGGLLALNQYPDEYNKLRANPTLIPSMASEIIRWQTPLIYMRRTATEDVELAGQQIRKGDRVVMWYLSGNRDEDVFTDAPAFVIDRPNARSHLSFGFGIHRCMGNRVAEMQLRVAWEEILKRFHSIEVTGPAERVSSNQVRGISRLPVRIPAAAVLN